jgi:ABC-type transport system substrate-binding protein
MFEQFRSFMENIGFPRDKIQPLTFATFGDYLKSYSQREVMLMTAGWTMDYPDAENTLQLYYGPNASPGSNSANFGDTAFDELYREAAVLEPSPRRTALFAQMNQRVIDNCATISGLNRQLIMLWNKRAIMRPDRSFVGGYFLPFVAMQPEANKELPMNP